MLEFAKTRGKDVVKFALALSPWILTMYLLYSYDADGSWSEQTPYRDLIKVVILVASMSVSFVLLSVFSRRK